MRIFIDAGHGGGDPGAVSNLVKEKDLTLAISNRIASMCMGNPNLIVFRSRAVDQSVSLSERVQKAERFKAELLLSIHINAGGGSGFESYILNKMFKNKQHTAAMQTRLHRTIIDNIDFKDRGQKQANFYMLRQSSMPAILTETGFIDHEQDRKKLMQDHNLTIIARAHVKAIEALVREQEDTREKEQLISGSFRLKHHAVNRQVYLSSVGINSEIRHQFIDQDSYYRVVIDQTLDKTWVIRKLKALNQPYFII